MSNNYYTVTYDFAPYTRVRSDQIDQEFAGIQTAFGMLPEPRTDGKKGFNEGITVPAPTEDGHAANKGYVDTGMDSQVAQASASATAAQAAQTATEAAQAAAENAQQIVEDQAVYRGDHVASTGAPATTRTGDIYRISVAGDFGGYKFSVDELAIKTDSGWFRFNKYSRGQLRYFGG